MQTDNPVLDGLARFMTNAAGAANALRAEIETIVKGRVERLVADLDFVPRDEFEAVKAMAAHARAENERLATRITALEKQAKRAPARSAPMRKQRAARVSRKKPGKL